MDWDSTGAKLAAVDSHSGSLSTIFGLLKDGAAHTFYFFFWVNQANNAVISLVQLWEGVGTCDTYGGTRDVLKLDFGGFAAVVLSTRPVGSGSARAGIFPTTYHPYVEATGDPAKPKVESLLIKEDYIRMATTVATDIADIEGLYLNVRSEQ